MNPNYSKPEYLTTRVITKWHQQLKAAALLQVHWNAFWSRNYRMLLPKRNDGQWKNFIPESKN